MTGMFWLVLYPLALIVLAGAALLGAYAAIRWLSSPADPSRWGTLTQSQLLLIIVRLRYQQPLLLKLVSAQIPSQDLHWWWQRSDTPPREGELLPRLTTWLLTDRDVEDLDGLRQAACDTPLVQSAHTQGGSGITRVRVEWDVEALSRIRKASSTDPGSRRGRPLPAPLIPPEFQEAS